MSRRPRPELFSVVPKGDKIKPDRHRGSGRPLSPATPPDKRVRIRRFEKLRSTETRDS